MVSDQESRGDRLTAARLRTLWSLALWHSGKTAAARTTFQPVVQLAEQQHLKGPFLDAGDTLQPLLIGMNDSSSACKEEGECKVPGQTSAGLQIEHRLIVEAPIFWRAQRARVSDITADR